MTLELELQAVVLYLMWVLGIKVRSTERTILHVHDN